jgi:Amt family ammonium transporter
MAGSYFLGPRIGKFVKNEETGKVEPVEIPGHNAVLGALGALILFFGFFPFNAGAGYHVASYEGITSTGRAVVVTVLAAGSGAVSLLLYGLWKFKCWDPAFAINGLLGGMVATCSGVNVYDSWIAVVIGILGAGGFYLQAWLFENKFHIDDPLNASALHMGSGIVGMIAVGFFANPSYLADPSQAGIFYGGNGKQLGYQTYGVVVYFAWSFGVSGIMFWGLNRLGWFRVSEEVELMGMDIHHHYGEAYPVQLDDSTRKEIESEEVVIEEKAIEEAGIDDVEEGGDVQDGRVPTKDSPETGVRHRSSQRRRSSNALDPGYA